MMPDKPAWLDKIAGHKKKGKFLAPAWENPALKDFQINLNTGRNGN